MARRVLLSRFLWLLLAVVALGFGVNGWVNGEGGARAVVQRWGIWAPVVSWLVKTVTTPTPVGAVLICVVNGALFDLWLAIVLNLTSGIAGGIGMYYIWRRGDHEFDIQAGMRRLPKWVYRHAGNNLLFLIVLRQLPWAGGGLADLIAGSHRIPMRTHLLSLFLGYLPGSVAYALLGAGLIRLK